MTVRSLYYTAAILCVTILSGCAGGAQFSVMTMMNNQVYIRDCVGPNAKFRPGDDECQYRNEPVPQPYSIQKVVKPDPADIQWQMMCRREIKPESDRKLCASIGL